MSRPPPEGWLDVDDGPIGAIFHSNERKPEMLKGWRTLLFNLGVAAVGVAQAFDWTSVLGATPYAGWVVTGIAVANAALRTVTNTSVGEKH